MPSLNNCNTRSQIVLDIPLCRTNKGQKRMSFLSPKIWNMLSSNTEAAATTAIFTHFLKKEILEILQQWTILLIFVDSWLFFLLLYFLRSYLQGDANGSKNRFRSFFRNPCHLWPGSNFLLFAFHEAKYFSM